jgi:lipoprotein-releasing system permease protein
LICIFTKQASNLNLPFFIAKRLISGDKKAFSTFILRISVLATTISVAAMIVALSFINGFQQLIAEKIFNFWGHMRVQHFEPVRSTIAEESPIYKIDSVEKKISQFENISSIAPFITKSAIIKSNESIEGVLVKGVEKNYPFEKINQFLVKGQWPSFQDSSVSNEIVLSKYTADQLNIDLGQSVLIYFIQENGELPKTRKLKVAGIYKTGIDVYDKVYAIGDLRLIQRLNEWGENQIGGYEIDLSEPGKMETTALDLYNQLPTGWNAITLKELSPEIFDWLQLQNTNKYILVVVMVIIAAINLITCLIILILERTKMIALLKAIGAKENSIQQVFLFYGTWIAMRGIGLGVLLGLGICYLQKYTKFIKLNEEAYYVDSAPVVVDYTQVLWVILSTLLISILTLSLPTIVSRNLNPSKALQFR